mgnify:CR=1 FL=1|tara:strand:+ start:824 stop:1798 length:975 start_codon:yes stop_codon:yes gene_type:complete
MTEKDKNLKIIHPQNQLKLFGYDDHFNSFISLYQKEKLPNTILLSGSKGSGKATFAYHFINYLLSYNEKDKYSLDNFTINPNNDSYINLCNKIHPNFFLLENLMTDDDIKIENVRSALTFLNKSTYSSDIKIVLIDSIDRLNVHSSNALLKVLEESKNKTYFFLINNNTHKILNTIKSRSIEFKFFFTLNQKKTILKNIFAQYENNFDLNNIDQGFYFDSPGNLLRYLMILEDVNAHLLKDKLSCIMYLIDKYKQKTDPQILAFISLLIELFYSDLSVKNNHSLSEYFVNKSKLLGQIDYAKRFNLDKKNLLLSIRETLQHEPK